MATKSSVASLPADQPYFDATAYGNGPDDFVTDLTENAAVTHHQLVLGGKTIRYAARAGHLVTVDPSTSKPAAKIFYVAFTADGANNDARPVTFFYNGGPGSSSVYVLLGSFAPKRLKTRMPQFTPPPYGLEPNPDSLLDKTDLVFINPVGTGYSAAIAPNTNRKFWGVDQDADSIKQFIKRFLTVYDRWASPKFLFGESYGTARSCVLAWKLHEDGIDLNGITLQSSILDYSEVTDPVGLLPTLAADAWYHQKINVTPRPELPSFMNKVVQFAQGDYAAAINSTQPPDWSSQLKTLQTLSDYTGIAPSVLVALGLVGVAGNFGNTFLVTLRQAEGLALGAYDGRVTGIDAGIAASINPLSGSNDPTMTAINGAYTALWNKYLNDELKFTATSAFTDANDQAFLNWDFTHIDPTNAQKGSTDGSRLYTAGDLAALMALNVDLKVLSLNGYFDSVTPFSRTISDLQNMVQQVLQDPELMKNITIKNYPSGHMIYLDGASRTAMKADLAAFYDSTIAARGQARHWIWMPQREDTRRGLRGLRNRASRCSAPRTVAFRANTEPAGQ
jgi:carboxypeptidase C (cathepsin A)